MLTYKVYFRIALFPEGVNGVHFEEEEGDDGVTYGEFVEDNEVFDNFLCSDCQAPFVVNELTSVYNLITGDTVTELQYEDNGKFNCKITLQSDEWLKDETVNELESYINELLWPADIHDSAFMFIKGQPLYLQLEIDYISNWLEEDEDDEEEDDEEEEESDYGEIKEQEDEEQYMYNGNYYADAMEMEAAIKEDFKWGKLRNQLSAKIYPEPSEPKNGDTSQQEKIEFS
jgi:hypothetical protein